MLLIKLINLLIENPLYFPIFFIILTVPLLVSITIHEWAHGFAAYKFGDDTPKNEGRLSLNPFRHLDPIGTLMLFIVGIGWAKPVMINPYNINSRNKLFMVAFAGPLSNFIMAVLFSFVIYFVAFATRIDFLNLNNNISAILVVLLGLIVKVNLTLGLFNLLPLPPLDGANMVRNLLPENLSEVYFRISPYGIPILMILIFTNALDYLLKFAEYLQILLLNIIGMFFNYCLQYFQTFKIL